MATGRKRVELEVVAEDRASSTLDEVTEIVEKLEGEKVEIPVDADTSQLEAKTKSAKGDIDKMSDSARGANSALANMVGNSAQDLGALGGFAGSAGVAIGQMAEYASDATLAGEGLGSALGSMAAVALPIAGLTVGMQLLSAAMGDGDEKAEAIAETTETFADALFRAADGGERLNDVLNQTARSEVDDFLSGLGDKTRPTITALQALGLGYDDLVAAFETGQGPVVDALERYREMSTAIDQIKFNEFVDTNDALILYAQRTNQNIGAVRKEWAAVNDLNDALGDQAELSAEGAENARLQAQFRDGAAIAAEHQRDALARLNTEGDRDGQIQIDRLEGLEEEERQRRLVAQASETQRDKLAAINVEAERVDRRRLLAQESDAVDTLADDYDALHEAIAGETSFIRLQIALQRAKERLAEGNLTWEEARLLVLETQEATLDYLETLDDVPQEKITEIVTQLDQFQFDAVSGQLTALSNPVTVPVTPDMSQWPAFTAAIPMFNMGAQQAAPVNVTVVNPPGTPAATIDSTTTWYGRNGQRIG